MNQNIKIGKSVIDQVYKLCIDELLDDEAELFPMVLHVLKGISNVIDAKNEKELVTNELVKYFKGLYIDRWLSQLDEDFQADSLEEEKQNAADTFDEILEDVIENYNIEVA